jgi:outer membrane protein OmpA-like peptidoglycan-associated protein
MFKTMSLPLICFRRIIRIIGFVFLFVICSFSYGINDTDTLAVTQLTHHWEIGFTGGLSRFVTSMNPNQDAVLKKFNYWNSDKNPAFSFSLIKNFSPSISAEFEWINTKLSGIWNKNKNYKVPAIAVANGLAYPEPFETGINEFDFLLNLKLKKLTSVFTNNKAWQLFIRAGIGLVLLKDDKALYHFDGPRNGYAYSILYGGGLSYRPSPKLAFKLGAMMSRVTTDRLDGVREIKPGQLPTGPNPYYYYNLKERYFRPYIGIYYTIGMKRKPVIEIIVRDSVPNFMDRAQFMPFLIKKTEAHLVVQYRPSIVGKVYNFYYGVGFGYDQSVLTAEAMVDIDKLAFELVTNPSVHAIIKGHTDSRGSNAYNLKLSAKRAQAVMDYLVKLGIKASRLHNRPMGESQPVNRCSDGVKCTEAEYALNRRTEILIVESEIKLDIEEDGKEVSKSVNTTSGQYIAEIQIGAFGNMVSVEKAKKMLEMIKGLPGTSVVFEDKFYKVRVIGFANREEALKYLPKLQGNGFPDARVIQVKEP